MASPDLLDLLNKAIARELQVSIQYMWHHVLWKGVKHFAVKDELKKISIAEMKHAEEIAERLFFLGGRPTTQPDAIFLGNNLGEMLNADKEAEEAAIRLYQHIVRMAEGEGDITTAHMFRKILAAEEEHLDTFVSLLEEL
jgi:bacterioferritin